MMRQYEAGIGTEFASALVWYVPDDARLRVRVRQCGPALVLFITIALPDGRRQRGRAVSRVDTWEGERDLLAANFAEVAMRLLRVNHEAR